MLGQHKKTSPKTPKRNYYRSASFLLQINTRGLGREQAHHYFKTKQLLLTALLVLLLIPMLFFALFRWTKRTVAN
jgi:hypothetical protein